MATSLRDPIRLSRGRLLTTPSFTVFLVPNFDELDDRLPLTVVRPSKALPGSYGLFVKKSVPAGTVLDTFRGVEMSTMADVPRGQMLYSTFTQRVPPSDEVHYAAGENGHVAQDNVDVVKATSLFLRQRGTMTRTIRQATADRNAVIVQFVDNSRANVRGVDLLESETILLALVTRKPLQAGDEILVEHSPEEYLPAVRALAQTLAETILERQQQYQNDLLPQEYPQSHPVWQTVAGKDLQRLREQTTNSVPVTLGKSSVAGTGVFATKDIPPRTTLGQYTGRIMHSAPLPFKEYVFEIDKNTYIDAGDVEPLAARMLDVENDDSASSRSSQGSHTALQTVNNQPSWTRYINSNQNTDKSTNVYFEIVQGTTIVNVVTERPIQRGEELLVSYGSNYFILPNEASLSRPDVNFFISAWDTVRSRRAFRDLGLVATPETYDNNTTYVITLQYGSGLDEDKYTAAALVLVYSPATNTGSIDLIEVLSSVQAVTIVKSALRHRARLYAKDSGWASVDSWKADAVDITVIDVPPDFTPTKRRRQLADTGTSTLPPGAERLVKDMKFDAQRECADVINTLENNVVVYSINNVFVARERDIDDLFSGVLVVSPNGTIEEACINTQTALLLRDMTSLGGLREERVLRALVRHAQGPGKIVLAKYNRLRVSRSLARILEQDFQLRPTA